ncbi:hypothetical protein ACFY4C_30805 [Actinomadura viridis]|uniref:hypothetical protein n=1 Tax=Actinomadura viridis TaxID=58110 RepID=UPI0036D11F3E
MRHPGRLLIIALGLLGLVAVPSAGTATAGAGSASGVRAGAPQAARASMVVVAARQTAEPHVPLPVPAVTPAGAQVTRPSATAGRAVAAPVAPPAPARAVPRGRAPPLSARI